MNTHRPANPDLPHYMSYNSSCERGKDKQAAKPLGNTTFREPHNLQKLTGTTLWLALKPAQQRTGLPADPATSLTLLLLLLRQEL